MRKIDEKTFLNTLEMSCENEQRFCFILGSGASRQSGIPTGAELAELWHKELFKRYTEAEALKKATLQEIDWTSIEKKNYFDLYDLLYYPRYENGYKYIERLMENANPSYGYYALAEHVSNSRNNVIITTNFDTLTEDTIITATSKKPLVLGHEALAGYIKTNMNRPIIAKIHRGLFLEPFNSREDIKTLPKEWQRALQEVFRQYIPIVIGYSGGDKGLMDFLQSPEAAIREIYWCYRKTSTPSPDIQDLVQKKNGYFVPIDENYGFDMLMFQIKNHLGHKSPCSYMKQTTDERIDAYIKSEARLKSALDAIQNPDEQQEDVKLALKEIGDEEIAKLLEELGDDPKDAYKCAILARRYSNTAKDYENAIKWYSNAIELDPNYATAYNNRGFSYDDLKEYEKAVADYTIAIELDPKDAKAYNNRGFSYNNLKNHEKAIADFNKAIELDSKDANPYNHRGFSYYNLKEYEKAISDFNTAIELNPKYVLAYQRRAATYEELKMFSEAEADRKTAAKLEAKE